MSDKHIDDSHFITPGAKRAFRRVTIAYIILAISATVGVWGLNKRADRHIRRDINKVSAKQCIDSIPTVKRVNAYFQSQIDIQEDARVINLLHGDIKRAKLNKRAVQAARGAMLHVSTKAECNKPLLKG